ncbi:MAG: chorismate mutase [Rhodothermaceae bacterium]|nr:chorismate mutase [Rhodothermaceae bacterium]
MLVESVQKMLEPLANGLPEVPEDPSIEDMEPWRLCINSLDRTIIRLLNERAICAKVIGQIKKNNGIPVYDPRREEFVLDNVQQHNEGPLSNEAVRRLFERIIDEIRSLERKHYGEKPPQNDV